MRIAVASMMLLVAVSLSAPCPAQQTQASQRPEVEQVSFETADGVTIVADYYAAALPAGQKAPVAILLHMYPSDRTSWRSFAPKLVKKGIAALAIDLRGHGLSVKPDDMKLAERRKKKDSRLYNTMDRDVSAAYQWLAGRGDVDLTRLAVVGASVGCSVAIDYARLDRSVDVVVCLSPGTNYLGVKSTDHIAKYGDRPILLMAGQVEQDDCATLGKLTGKATIKIYPMADRSRFDMHGTNLLAQAGEAEKVALDFLLANIGKAATEPVVASINSDVYHRPDSHYVRRIKPENLRWFSSAAEAEGRGLRSPRPPKTKTKSSQ